MGTKDMESSQPSEAVVVVQPQLAVPQPEMLKKRRRKKQSPKSLRRMSTWVASSAMKMNTEWIHVRRRKNLRLCCSAEWTRRISNHFDGKCAFCHRRVWVIVCSVLANSFF